MTSAKSAGAAVASASAAKRCWAVGDPAEARFQDGKWYACAVIRRRASDGSYTVVWRGDGTNTEGVPEKGLRPRVDPPPRSIADARRMLRRHGAVRLPGLMSQLVAPGQRLSLIGYAAAEAVEVVHHVARWQSWRPTKDDDGVGLDANGLYDEKIERLCSNAIDARLKQQGSLARVVGGIDRGPRFTLGLTKQVKLKLRNRPEDMHLPEQIARTAGWPGNTAQLLSIDCSNVAPGSPAQIWHRDYDSRSTVRKAELMPSGVVHNLALPLCPLAPHGGALPPAHQSDAVTTQFTSHLSARGTPLDKLFDTGCAFAVRAPGDAALFQPQWPHRGAANPDQVWKHTLFITLAHPDLPGVDGAHIRELERTFGPRAGWQTIRFTQ